MPALDQSRNQNSRTSREAAELLARTGLGSFAAAFDLLPCGISVAFDSKNGVYHNQAALRFLHAKPGDDFIELDRITLYHQSHRLTAAEWPIRLAMSSGTATRSEEYRCIFPDGTTKTCLLSAEPLRDDKGIVCGALATFLDLTEQKRVENERDMLSSEVQDLRQLMDGITSHAPLSLCAIDQSLTVRWSNQHFLQLLPESRPTATGFSLEALLPGLWQSAVVSAIKQVFITGKTKQVQCYLPTCGEQSGPVLHLTALYSGGKTASNQPLVLLALTNGAASNASSSSGASDHPSLEVAADRTSEPTSAKEQLSPDDANRQLLADEACRSSQRALEMLDATSDNFISTDRQFNITYANQAAAKHYRRKREELIGLNMSDLSPRFATSEFRHNYLLALSSQRPVHFETFGHISYRWMSVHVYPTASGLAMFFRDITNQRTEQAAVSRLSAIIESSSSAIIFLSPDQVIEAWSPGAEQMFKLPAEEALGQSILLLYPPDRLSELEQLNATNLAGSNVLGYETVRRRKDGSLLDVELYTSPMRNAIGDIIGRSIIYNDISERKRMEREFIRLDRLNLAAQLATSIGHEIRNPMTTVRGFLQFLAMKPHLDHEKEYFQLMIEELDRANAIITEFLSLAKSKPVNRKMGNLSDIVQQLAPLIQSDAALHDHELQLELDQVPDLLLEEKDIRQLLLNLTRNGLEAMSTPGLLTVRTVHAADHIRLEVTDQGPGIAKDYLDQLYVPFFTTKDSGTGLGLSVCYRIADQHGAKIEIATGQGGTTVSVLFPVPGC